MELTQEYLKSILAYDQIEGIFIWLTDDRFGERAGSLSGTGYRYISINGKSYAEHRLAWLYEYGRWPFYQIDHINHIKDANHIANLRDVSQVINTYNSIKNSSEETGGTWNKYKNKWEATITSHKVKYFLGYFDSLKEARKAYKKAKRILIARGTLEGSNLFIDKNNEDWCTEGYTRKT